MSRVKYVAIREVMGEVIEEYEICNTFSREEMLEEVMDLMSIRIFRVEEDD